MIPTNKNSAGDQADNHAAQPAARTPMKDFVLGLGFSGLLIAIGLSLSLWTTQTSFTEFGQIKLAIALSIPLLCGVLGIIFPKPMMQVVNGLSAISEVLPF